MMRNLLGFIILSLMLSGCSTSSSSDLSLSQILENIAAAMPPVLAMITAGAYLFGFILIFKGIYKLREFGEQRGQGGGQQHPLVPAIWMLVSGSLLIYFPSAYEIGLQTIFSYNSPLAYPGTEQSQQDIMLNAVMIILQIIGAISFIKGVMMLSHSGGQQQQQGQGFGKALTHIIGGLMAINAWGTWEVLANTVAGS